MSFYIKIFKSTILNEYVLPEQSHNKPKIILYILKIFLPLQAKI